MIQKFLYSRLQNINKAQHLTTIFWKKKNLLQQPLLDFTAFCGMNSNTCVTNSDGIHMTSPELIQFHGYREETHHIWTQDGYRLEVHRVMPKGNKISLTDNLNQFNNIKNAGEEKSIRRPVVVIMHGLLSSSADWLLLGEKKALAYLLCDEGYDVWLANARGNRYSRCHKKYTTKDKEFWDFSWHEIGVYDLPATIDYILDKTGNSDLYYIGYSQGTTVFFVMTSVHSKYIEKIRGMICLAPIAFLSNHRSPLLKCIVPMHIVLKWASTYCNINQYFQRNKLQVVALTALMRRAPDTITKTFCICWFYMVAGFGSDQLDKAMLPLVLGHFPAGTSAKQVIHYCQAIQTGKFQQFDYGVEMNLKLYSTEKPPVYDLSKVKVPVAIFHSNNDFLTQPSDVDRLVKALPNVTNKIQINHDKFNHIDYLWGRDARTLVYNDIIRVLQQF